MRRRSQSLTVKALCAAVTIGALGVMSGGSALANGDNGETGSSCATLPSHQALKAALDAARAQKNGGFDLDMWAALVDRDGVVCQVAFTGSDRGAQWPGSRVIAAQKANTANSFSLPGLALSTANLYAAVQPGGTLYGLQHSNPVDTAVAYKGPSSSFGQENDPMVGHKIGGVNVFGGGLALYNARHELLGAVGVSGDTSCADHNISWRVRHILVLDYVTAGVSGKGDDNINYIGIVPVPSLSNDFSHPICKIAGVDGVSAISAALPPIR